MNNNDELKRTIQELQEIDKQEKEKEKKFEERKEITQRMNEYEKENNTTNQNQDINIFIIIISIILIIIGCYLSKNGINKLISGSNKNTNDVLNNTIHFDVYLHEK